MKIEMHTHTSESSPCAHISARELPSLYQQAGYNAVVITDHYCKWVMEQSGAATPEAYVNYFLSGYHTACEAARNSSLAVWLGAEVNLLESPNDYLLYGATEDFFRENLSLFELSQRELYELCHKHQILLFQAHPYRTYCTPGDPDYLDGAESYNGNPRHNNQNDLASHWVDKHHLIASSGSDFHEEEDLAKGGLFTEQPVADLAALCRLLQHGGYQLLQS